jgi:hypothetical protein
MPFIGNMKKTFTLLIDFEKLLKPLLKVDGKHNKKCKDLEIFFKKLLLNEA